MKSSQKKTIARMEARAQILKVVGPPFTERLTRNIDAQLMLGDTELMQRIDPQKKAEIAADSVPYVSPTRSIQENMAKKPVIDAIRDVIYLGMEPTPQQAALLREWHVEY